FRCIYCYETFPAGRMRKSVREGIKKFIAKQEGLKYLHIAWFGGEPLLASDVVIELSQFFHEYCQIHSISLSSDMTTNGSLLVPEVFEQIVQYGVRSFQITIDGLPEDHDKRRVTIHGEGTFANILANLRYMKSTRHSFIVGLRNNFDPESIVKVNDFIGLMKAEFGGDPRFKLFFRPIGRLGGANDQSLMVCEAREAERIMMQAQRLAVEAGFRGGCSANLGHNRVLEPFSFVCYAANPRSFIISPQGKIYKCTIELGEKERNIVGRLSNEGELELDPIKMALWTESDGRREGAKCHACFFAPACVGAVCPKEWMDRNDCSCPTEKKRIGEALELAVMQKKLPTPVTA
ncbi:MAG: radical SAM protein, partial [Anaerolineales bacterium]|nr:radical SAM protein [Anaerolineales bacterium]